MVNINKPFNFQSTWNKQTRITQDILNNINQVQNWPALSTQSLPLQRISEMMKEEENRYSNLFKTEDFNKLLGSYSIGIDTSLNFNNLTSVNSIANFSSNMSEISSMLSSSVSLPKIEIPWVVDTQWISNVFEPINNMINNQVAKPSEIFREIYTPIRESMESFSSTNEFLTRQVIYDVSTAELDVDVSEENVRQWYIIRDFMITHSPYIAYLQNNYPLVLHRLVFLFLTMNTLANVIINPSFYNTLLLCCEGYMIWHEKDQKNRK